MQKLQTMRQAARVLIKIKGNNDELGSNSLNTMTCGLKHVLIDETKTNSDKNCIYCGSNTNKNSNNYSIDAIIIRVLVQI